jgi:wax ester synthase-like acyl-CoA acyltransferase family protein
MFMKAHHVVADGIAGVALLGNLLDLDPGATEPGPQPWRPAPPPGRRALLEYSRRGSTRSVIGLAGRLAHPARALGRVRPVWSLVAEVLGVGRQRPAGRGCPVLLDQLTLAVLTDEQGEADLPILLAGLAAALADLADSP